jgi:hypothetical protein
MSVGEGFERFVTNYAVPPLFQRRIVEPQRRKQRRIFVRVGLLAGISFAVSLMPLNQTDGSHASAAETGLPKIRLDSLKNVRKAFDWIVQGKKFATELPKRNASPLAQAVAKHRGKIKDLVSELLSHGDWVCKTADYLETYSYINQRPPNSYAVTYAQIAALANGADVFAGRDLVNALESLSDGAIRETIDAACEGRL